MSGETGENSTDYVATQFITTSYAVTDRGLGTDIGVMMLNDSDLSSNSSAICQPLEKFDSLPFKGVAIVCSLIALFSLLCSVGVVLVILCSKKYRVFHQLLTLHLAIATIAHSLIYTIGRVDFSAERELTPPYCMFIGYADLYTSFQKGWTTH